MILSMGSLCTAFVSRYKRWLSSEVQWCSRCSVYHPSFIWKMSAQVVRPTDQSLDLDLKRAPYSTRLASDVWSPNRPTFEDLDEAAASPLYVAIQGQNTFSAHRERTWRWM